LTPLPNVRVRIAADDALIAEQVIDRYRLRALERHIDALMAKLLETPPPASEPPEAP
jgi:hypothetical protein